MLDGALFFVKSARYGKSDKNACSVFFFRYFRKNEVYGIAFFP